MKHDFDAVLDECLDLLRSGIGVQTCLALYPQYELELRPLLQLAADVRAVTPPAPAIAARVAGRRRMLEAFAQQRARRPASIITQLVARLAGQETGNARPVWRLAAAVAVIVMMVAALGGTAAASAASLPGDALYPVKLAVRQAGVALTFDATARKQLEDQFSAQQRQDVQAALQAGRRAAVQFQGILQQIDENTWIVSGLTVTLQSGTTTVVGDPSVGAWVIVRGYLPGDGTLVATHLEVTSSRRSVLPPTPEPIESKSGEKPEPTQPPGPAPEKPTPRPTPEKPTPRPAPEKPTPRPAPEKPTGKP
jgi:hypothetical protein